MGNTLHADSQRQSGIALEVGVAFYYKISTSLGGSQQRCIRGSSARGSNPLSFYIPFLAEEAPLSYTFYRQMVLLAGGAFPFRPLYGVPPGQYSDNICCEY